MQQALALFDEIPSVETLRTKREDQWFDRKSFRIRDHDLAADMIGFANADGGRIVIGIHNGEIEGIRNYCETDVANTYLVYLRFQLMRGALTRKSWQSECDLVRSTLAKSDAPHWQEFLALWK